MGVFRHPIVVTFAIFAFLYLFVRFGPSLPFSVYSQQKGEPFVVTGEGKVTVSPNIAKVDFGITDSNSSLKAAQESVNTKAKAVTDAISKLGIANSDIKTTAYSIFPQYDYTSTTPKITGYQVSASYEVTIKNFDMVNDTIVAATSAGANTVGGVNFAVDDTTQKQKLQEARNLAVKDAKDKAQGLAGAAGIALGKIINVSENQNFPGPQPLSLPVSGGGGGAPEKITPPNIQPGTNEIDVSVSLSYEVR